MPSWLVRQVSVCSGPISSAGLLTNHALVDGNERLGWLSAAVFLQINGINISRASNDDVYGLVMDLAAGKPTVEAIAERLQQLAR